MKPHFDRDIEQIDYGNQYKASGSSQIIQVESSKLIPMIVIMAIMTGISTVASFMLYEAYRHKEQTEDLKRYDLDSFKQNDWASLKTQVETQNALIQAYGLQKAVKEAAKEK